jgi:DNA-directed RNA polymerase specialized sigma24 family protein
MPRHTYDQDDPEVARHPNHPHGSLGPLFGPVPAQQSSDTSVAAAEAMTPGIVHLRRRVAEAFVAVGEAGATADEIAASLNLSVLAVRPRATELYQAGLLEDTGVRRQNESGMSARVLRACT